MDYEETFSRVAKMTIILYSCRFYSLMEDFSNGCEACLFQLGST